MPADREVIKQRLKSDPYWRITVLGKKWVCPYSGQLGATWNDEPDEMVDEVVNYLENECADWNDGNGELIPFEKLKLLQFTHEAKHRLRHDEAWRVKLNDGRWVDPYTGRITDIVIRDDEPLTRSKFQEIVDYLTSLTEFDDGNGDTLPLHQLKSRQQFHDSPNWKTVSPNGKWVNPFTTRETDIDYSPEREDEVWPLVWKHLTLCRAYNNGEGQSRPMAELNRSLERGERLNVLAKAVADKFQADIHWQAFNAQSLWECPFCGAGVGNIKPAFDNPVTIRVSSVNIAKHLLYACRVFQETSKDVTIEQLATLLDRVPMEAEATPLPAGSGGSDEFFSNVVIAHAVPEGEAIEAEAVPAHAQAEPIEAEAVPAQAEPIEAEAVPAQAEAVAQPASPRGPGDISRAVTTNISRVIEERQAEETSHGAERDRAFEEARRKQLRMLPEPPEVDGLECAVVYQPCDMVGGDFYDFINLPSGKLGIVQGDVSGHGLEVWGDMTMAMKTLRIYAKQSESSREMLINANDDLVPDLMAKTFVSAFYCILDTESFKLKLARAGHNPLILFNPDRKPQSLIQYEPRGMVLGMARGNMFNNTLEELEIQLYSGDMLLWYTDGVTEAMDPAGEEFGIERFCQVIEQHGRREAEYLLQQIMVSLDEFRQGGAPDDDITLMAVRII